MRGDKMRKGSALIMFITILFLAIIPVIYSEVDALSTSKGAGKELSDEKIFSLTEAFIETLVQPTDDEYRVKGFNQKKDLIAAFDEIATENAVKEFVDFFYQEKNNKLYIVPTELPPWFKKNQSFEVTEVDKNKILISQSNETELYGKYKVNIFFQRKGGDWVIDKVTYE
jgi:hypothetical protein